MTYLDLQRLEREDDCAFRETRPYPWLAAEGLLSDEGYRRLVTNLPAVSSLEPFFGVKRAHGQQPHDRYVLEYRDDVDVPAPWHELVEELRGPAYTRFLRRMFGRGRLTLTFHWHYAPNGCSVSPHCDSVRKLGSHIFYLNTAGDWRPEWGGDTLILEDNGRLDRNTLAPSNAALVRQVADLLPEHGRRPATAAEARQLRSLPPAG